MKFGKEYHAEWRKNNPQNIAVKNKKYYEKNKDALNKVSREYHRLRYMKIGESIKEKTAMRREEAKMLVMSHYGVDGIAKCHHCSISDIDVLCIDHIEDNGGVQRKEHAGQPRGGSGSRFYFYLIRNDYPDGYQTLCANCNLSKEIKRKRAVRGY